MTKLKPCPFCTPNDENLQEWGDPDSDEEFSEDSGADIECLTCGCKVDSKLWNTRPIEDAQATLITQLGEALMKSVVLDLDKNEVIPRSKILKAIELKEMCRYALSAFTSWKEKQK